MEIAFYHALKLHTKQMWFVSVKKECIRKYYRSIQELLEAAKLINVKKVKRIDIWMKG